MSDKDVCRNCKSCKPLNDTVGRCLANDDSGILSCIMDNPEHLCEKYKSKK